jgi:hypothetical protein
MIPSRPQGTEPKLAEAREPAARSPERSGGDREHVERRHGHYQVITFAKLAALRVLSYPPNPLGIWCPGAESNHRHRDFQIRTLGFLSETIGGF